MMKTKLKGDARRGQDDDDDDEGDVPASPGLSHRKGESFAGI